MTQLVTIDKVTLYSSSSSPLLFIKMICVADKSTAT